MPLLRPMKAFISPVSVMSCHDAMMQTVQRGRPPKPTTLKWLWIPNIALSVRIYYTTDSRKTYKSYLFDLFKEMFTALIMWSHTVKTLWDINRYTYCMFIFMNTTHTLLYICISEVRMKPDYFLSLTFLHPPKADKTKTSFWNWYLWLCKFKYHKYGMSSPFS